jgi:YHS domain-containing protein
VSTRRADKKYHFCSKACRDQFLSEHSE